MNSDCDEMTTKTINIRNEIKLTNCRKILHSEGSGKKKATRVRYSLFKTRTCQRALKKKITTKGDETESEVGSKGLKSCSSRQTDVQIRIGLVLGSGL